ncbi:MAG TPA: hypothetical protein DEQ55_08415, partial [Pseudomonas sp.]|nr:hypothetical protein [Pseudomonas sp.]
LPPTRWPTTLPPAAPRPPPMAASVRLRLSAPTMPPAAPPTPAPMVAPVEPPRCSPTTVPNTPPRAPPTAASVLLAMATPPVVRPRERRSNCMYFMDTSVAEPPYGGNRAIDRHEPCWVPPMTCGFVKAVRRSHIAG